MSRIALKLNHGTSVPFLLILCLLLPVKPAQGVVYLWKDAAGTSHYANRVYDIPERYRKRAKPVYPESGDSAVMSAPAGRSEGTSAAIQQPPPEPTPAPSPITQPETRPIEQKLITAPVPTRYTVPVGSARKNRRHGSMGSEE